MIGDAKTISGRICEAMKRLDVKPVELSRRTGISKSSISQYMSGYAAPKSDRIYLIAKALNVSEAWLIGYDEPMEKTPEIDYVINTSTSENLTPNEQIIIERYRSIPEDKKSEFLGRIFAYSEALMKGGSE
jgi:transcriptional regulator with XRE-family HTH domain